MLAPWRRPVWSDIARSWMAMKTWVKLWLFFLNAVFLAGLAFLDDPVGHWTAAAYVAAGPLLLAIMIAQRGLTRLLGVAHLVPWTPLVAYLTCRLLSGAAGPRIGPDSGALFWYSLLLLASVLVCLAFDVYDVVRWTRGERFVLGSPEAFRAGASKLAT